MLTWKSLASGDQYSITRTNSPNFLQHRWYDIDLGLGNQRYLVRHWTLIKSHRRLSMLLTLPRRFSKTFNNFQARKGSLEASQSARELSRKVLRFGSCTKRFEFVVERGQRRFEDRLEIPCPGSHCRGARFHGGIRYRGTRRCHLDWRRLAKIESLGGETREPGRLSAE